MTEIKVGQTWRAVNDGHKEARVDERNVANTDRKWVHFEWKRGYESGVGSLLEDDFVATYYLYEDAPPEPVPVAVGQIRKAWKGYYTFPVRVMAMFDGYAEIEVVKDDESKTRYSKAVGGSGKYALADIMSRWPFALNESEVAKIERAEAEYKQMCEVLDRQKEIDVLKARCDRSESENSTVRGLLAATQIELQNEQETTARLRTHVLLLRAAYALKDGDFDDLARDMFYKVSN